MRALWGAALAGLLVWCGCDGRDASPVVTGTSPGAMRGARLAHTQTKLPDGRLLVVGGLRSAKGLLPPANNDVEVFEVSRGGFRVVAQMKTVRAAHSATLLSDGRVVFIGGTPGTAVDIFNTHTGRLEPGGNVAESRSQHTATHLPDDRILLVGGARYAVTYHGGDLHAETRYLNSIELYDARARSGRRLKPTLRTPRRGHTATRLPDGRVLIIGGTWAGRTEIIDARGDGCVGSARRDVA